MVRYRDGFLEVWVPHWLSRLIVGRKRWDAAIRGVEERAEIHGKAAVTVQLNSVTRCEITAERAD